MSAVIVTAIVTARLAAAAVIAVIRRRSRSSCNRDKDEIIRDAELVTEAEANENAKHATVCRHNWCYRILSKSNFTNSSSAFVHTRNGILLAPSPSRI